MGGIFGRRQPRAEALLLCFGVNENFLSHVVLPAATRLAVGPGETLDRILRRLPRGCRVVLPAINLTRPWPLLPGRAALQAALAERGIALLNRRVEDQGKRALQAALARLDLPTTAAAAGRDPLELLLVKSELNSGAIAERQLSPAQRVALGLAPVPPQVPGRDAYRLLPRGEVPPAWFADPWLHIERYVPAPGGVSFRLLLAGRTGAAMVRRGDAPVVRAARAPLLDLVLLSAGREGWEPERPSHPALAAVLAAVGRLATGCGLDFGALDVVVDGEGRAYVIDLNLTPHQGVQRDNAALNRHLRAGLLAD